MRSETQPYLERVETAIDREHLRSVAALHAACRRYEPIPRLPTVVGFPPADWPQFNFQEILKDREKMLLAELAGVYAGCLLKDDRLPTVRANFGTGILPSLFGCEIMTFADNLPAALPFHDTDKIRALVAAGVPDLRGGQGARVLDMVAFYKEAFAPYPNLRECVNIALADTQGPFDAAEIIWGSEIFLALYDEPELAHNFLTLVTETIRQFTLAHQSIDGQPFAGPCSEWGSLGRVCVREDASVNLGLEHYETFVKPYTQRLLDEFGGCIHWCGDAKAWWRSLITSRKLTAVNPFQGQFYDPVELHLACRQAGVALFQWTSPLSLEARKRITTGMTLMTWTGNLEDARRVYAEWTQPLPSEPV